MRRAGSTADRSHSSPATICLVTGRRTHRVLITNAVQRGLLMGGALLCLVLGTLIAMFEGVAGLVVGSVMAAAAAFIGWRALRFGIEASHETITVRNLGRTYALPWSEVSDLRVEVNSNVTGLAHCLVVHLAHGKPIEAMGTASYSQRKVEAMCTRLERVRPSA